MVFTTLLKQLGFHYRMSVFQLVTSVQRDLWYVDTDLVSYADADFFTSIDDRHSVSGYVFFCVEVLSAGSPVHSLLLRLVHLSQSIWLLLLLPKRRFG